MPFNETLAGIAVDRVVRNRKCPRACRGLQDTPRSNPGEKFQ